jgi:hypothetical protein
MKTNTPIVTQEQNIFYPIVKTESAQIAITGGATNNEFYFTTLPLLQDAHLLNLECDLISNTPLCPDKTANIPANLSKVTFLTLVNYNGKQIVHDYPVSKLNYQGTAETFSNLQKQFKGQRIDWQKSYVRFADNSLIPAKGTDTAVLFTVYYSDVRSVEKKDAKASFHNKS